MELFAQRLRSVRFKAGLTQREMAKNCDVSPASLSAYETGTKIPPLDIAYRIAAANGVSLDWLCGYDDTLHNQTKPETVGDILRIIFDLTNLCGETIRIREDTSVSAGEIDKGENACALVEQKSANGSYYFLRFGSIDIMDSQIGEFFASWARILNLYRDNTIDREIYDAWVEKKLRDFESAPTEHQIYDLPSDTIPQGISAEYGV